MRKNHASMLFIVDRSGSMMPLVDDTIGGFNAVLEDNKKEEGTADVTLVLFDHEFLRPVDHVDIQEVKPLNHVTYIPRGTTALLDAVGMGVSEELIRQATLPEDEKPEKTLVTIITDGQENASKEWSYARVKELLTTVQKEQRWVVSFLGANIDVAKEAESLGIRSGMASGYVSDGFGTAVAYKGMSTMQRMARAMSFDDYDSDDDFEDALFDTADDAFGEVREDYEKRGSNI